MKCPFELPLRKYQRDKNSKYCEIHSLSGHIADLVTLEDADYIVQVLNSYEKLVAMLEQYQTDEFWNENPKIAIDTMCEALALLPCETCGGTGKKPRAKGDRHCKLARCIKTHDRITCAPGGITCEFYIPSDPCPDCQPKPCETCGDSGFIPENQRDNNIVDIPCPDCQPKENQNET